MDAGSTYDEFPELSKEDLVAAGYGIMGGSVSDLQPDQLARLMTIASFVFDSALSEFERRGLLEMADGRPLIPYLSEHSVETVLTRPATAEGECCMSCQIPFKAGDLYYPDVSGGNLHARCCGPERESYVGPDGEPLGENDPIPQPSAWEE